MSTVKPLWYEIFIVEPKDDTICFIMSEVTIKEDRTANFNTLKEWCMPHSKGSLEFIKSKLDALVEQKKLEKEIEDGITAYKSDVPIESFFIQIPNWHIEYTSQHKAITVDATQMLKSNKPKPQPTETATESKDTTTTEAPESTTTESTPSTFSKIKSFFKNLFKRT